MNERELRRRLQQAAARADGAARDRSWSVVQAAFAERPATRRRRGPARLATAVALAAVVAGAAVAAATTPRSGVGRLVRDVLGIGAPHARPALVHVPGGGRLLVQSGRSTWVVRSDGERRRLGTFDGAAWSPRGLYVAAWRGGVLSAVDPSGRVHWALSRPGRIAAARWSPVDGFRIAYVESGSLRVVNGDGSGDRRYGAADAAVAPAWRPDNAHVLAYVDGRGRVTVAAVDLGRRLWRGAAVRDPVALAWAPDGRRLLVLSRDRAVIHDAAGRLVASRRLPGLDAGAWSPRTPMVAVVQHDARAGTSTLRLLDTAHGLAARLLFSGPGSFGSPAWSPDGRSLLLPWPSAGQWLFLRPRAGARPIAVANIATQFAPGAARPRFPRAVQRCCR